MLTFQIPITKLSFWSLISCKPIQFNSSIMYPSKLQEKSNTLYTFTLGRISERRGCYFSGPRQIRHSNSFSYAHHWYLSGQYDLAAPISSPRPNKQMLVPYSRRLLPCSSVEKFFIFLGETGNGTHALFELSLGMERQKFICSENIFEIASQI